MSISFWSLWLGSLAGITTYYLIENIYYEIRSRIHTRQYNQFLDEMEDEFDVDFK
jgi:hypothetical protein